MPPISWTRVIAGGLAALGVVVGLFVMAVAGHHDSASVAPSYNDPAAKAQYRAMNELAAYAARRGMDAPALQQELNLSQDQLVARVDQWLQANPESAPDQVIYDSLKKAPGHFYNFKENGSFGYKDSDGSGIVKFVRYLGTNQQGRHVLQMNVSNDFIEMWCEGNCDLVHATQITVYGFGSTHQESQVFNPERGTILWAMVHDMLTGKMDPDGA